MFTYLKKYAPQVAVAVALLILSQGFILFQPKIIEIIIDIGVEKKDLFITLIGAGGILLAAVFSLLLQFGSGSLRIKAAEGVAYDIRNTLYQKIMSSQLSSLQIQK